jgi:hypothetical protein
LSVVDTLAQKYASVSHVFLMVMVYKFYENYYSF